MTTPDWVGPQVRPWMIAAIVTVDRTRWLGRTMGAAWQDLSAPPDIVVPVGSLSKLVGSVLALRLACVGALDLSAPASSVSDPFRFGRPTIGELMAHTASLLPMVTVPVVVAAPGTQWCYSNAGYCALAAEITLATGVPFRRMVIEEIGPLTGSRLGQPFIRIPESGFELVGKRVLRVPYVRPHGGWPSYGMIGSPEDVARFVGALALDPSLRTVLDRLREPWRSRGVVLSLQGTGARRRCEHGRVWAAHGGQWVGYSHYVAIAPGAAVLVLSNYRDNGGSQARHAAHTLMADVAVPAVSEVDGDVEPVEAELAAPGPAVLSMAARGSLGRRVLIGFDRCTGALRGRRTFPLTPVPGFPGIWSYSAKGEHRHLSFTRTELGDLLMVERPGCLYTVQ
ncbi:MAG TPA: serine hydrolase domain-containing protein [Pseudonocardiaceae bacterium]|jgi:CubicO group peptidase (beta-lactamase class C family)